MVVGLVGLVGRYDLIFFKLFAAADSTGPTSVHYQDLLALRPSAEELRSAVAWVETQDASPEFAAVLHRVVTHVRTDLALEGRPPRWGRWHERFVFTVAFLQWAEAARERPLSHYALGAKGRELLERHRAVFEHDQLAVWSQHTPVQDWAVFLSRTVRSLVSWMEEMA